jgi:radical SAM protein with 4Fe4S-binding SPASM domain
VPEVSGNVVRERLRARAMEERIPLHVDVEIIATCNYKCVHCYIAPCAQRDDVMSLDAARRIFAMLQAAGTMSVLLTGGEVFSHRHFREIYLAAKRAGLFVYINTNAYFINERWADFLAEWPPKTVSISLYGATRETYERLTGIPRSYDRCLRAIDLLLDRGIPIELKCPAMTITADELPLMRDFAERKGVSFRYDTSVMPQEGGAVTPLQLQLSPDRVVALDARMDPGLKQFKQFAEGRVGGITGPAVYRCGAGRTGFAVKVDGGVTTCLTSRQVVGNLLEHGFDEVWAALGGKVARRFPADHPCATCRFRAVCVGCPATVEQLTGLPEGYVQHYCRITHLRAHNVGLHESGVPRTVREGIPASVATVQSNAARALPVLN